MLGSFWSPVGVGGGDWILTQRDFLFIFRLFLLFYYPSFSHFLVSLPHLLSDAINQHRAIDEMMLLSRNPIAEHLGISSIPCAPICGGHQHKMRRNDPVVTRDVFTKLLLPLFNPTDYMLPQGSHDPCFFPQILRFITVVLSYVATSAPSIYR